MTLKFHGRTPSLLQDCPSHFRFNCGIRVQWRRSLSQNAKPAKPILENVDTQFGKKKGPNLWGLFSVMPRLGTLKLDSGLQYSLYRRDTGKLPFIPHLVHHLLNVGEVLFFEVIEAALFGEKILYRNSSLAGFPRVPGVNDVAVHHLVERVEAAFDSQLAELV